MPSKIPKEDLLEDIKRIEKMHKGYLSEEEYTKKGDYHGRTATRRFGKWSNALEKAGAKREKREIPKRKIIEDLNNANQKVDRKLSKRDYRKHGNYSDNTVTRILNCTWDEAKQKAGLEIIQGKRPSYKYDINEDFFKEWDSKTAYVFGYLIADGSVITNRKIGDEYRQIQYNVKFLTKDREILEGIKKAMEADHPVKNVECKTRGKIREYHKFNFSRKEIVEDLLELGVTQNKTGKIQMPNFIPKKYMNDFIRGYFDGDGSITNSKNVVFTSKSKEFIEDLEKYISKELNLKTDYKSTDNHDCLNIHYYGENKINIIREFLYGDKPNLFLSRKRNRFRKYST